MELAMDVAAYRDRGINLDDVAFFNEELTSLVTEVADGRLGDGSAGAEVGDCSDVILVSV